MRIFAWAVAALLLLGSQANADIRITEVCSWGNDFIPIGSDWFELTNFSNASIDISGWKVDDSSNSFASSVALAEVTSIAAGQTVVFMEVSAASFAARVEAFNNAWFGTPTSSVIFGRYSGSGIGLSGGSGDALNIYTSSGSLVTNVVFGASPLLPTPSATFDNFDGQTGSISNFSVVGTNGAFLSFDGLQIGSPGAVPEPSALGLLAVAGVVAGGLRRNRS